MTRLIDADALKEYIDCGHLRNPCEVCFSELDVVNLIDAQPTIDAVPLSAVRKAAKKLAYIHQQIDLYGDRPDLHEEDYWYEYLIDEEWEDAQID